MGLKYVILIILMCMLTVTAHAATLHGTVYDMSLNPAEDTIVRIDSTPEQTYVAKDGTFSFELNPGNYTITAIFQEENKNYADQQTFVVADDGTYVLDMIVFLDISEEQALLDENIDIPQIASDVPSGENYNYIPFVIIILIIALVAIVLFFIFRKKKKKTLRENDLKDDILDFIIKSGGRVTQKEVRKAFPVSEAKVSLVLTEIEHDGTINKIKQGKGNIIILNKKN
jgi:LPXTG-motif cell wall-anchored protein